jgi:hypothetical protein
MYNPQEIVAIEQLTAKLWLWTAEIKAGLNKYGRYKYNPNQPRVPSGNNDGGQWTDGSGGTPTARPMPRPRANPMNAIPQRRPAGLTKPDRDSIIARINQNAPRGLSPRDLEVDPRFNLPRWYVEGAISPTISPLDFIGGGGFIRNQLRLRIFTGRGIAKDLLTSHGGARTVQRFVYDKDVQAAIDSAEKLGRVTTKIGKYGTPQLHYSGSNGLTVIIETEGRNAGKIITLYGKKPGGKK